jgi:hypothetical protein
MEQDFRQAYNGAFSEEFYRGFLAELEQRLGCAIPFRVAETPLFMPLGVRDGLAKSAQEIAEQVCQPELVSRLKTAIPERFDVPHMDDLPNCLQVDFALVRNPDGHLEGKVVELQAFPSLYCLMVLQTEVVGERMRAMSEELDREWSMYFGDVDRDRYVAHLREVIVADEDPETVVLLDIQPEKQKTYPDFAATKKLLGIDAICPSQIEREGRRLFRRAGDRRVPIKRIYNRIVFDELVKNQVEMPFSYTEDLDVTWFSHPNWYWTLSKYTLPSLDHHAVPKSWFVSELECVPEDLDRYVLKPLFSFAGAGVKVDVTREDVDAIPDAQRAEWILQEKVAYEPALLMPDGSGVKAEIRMMFLRAPDEPKPTLVMNLARLSRGKMLGVDQNRNLTWVGGSVALWPR